MSSKKVFWPAWRYGPNGQSEVFQNPDEVPLGWQDHPSKVREPEDEPPKNSKTAWGGYHKDELIQALRQSGEKINAQTSARKLYEKCEDLGLFVDESEELEQPAESDEPEDGAEDVSEDDNA